MSTADFKGTGSTSGAHPSGSAGLVVAGETLTLQLEASPGLDIERAVFAVVVGDSASAPAITLSPADGIPTPTPLSSISYVVPAGVHTYSIRCVVNNGIDKLGQVRPEWTRTRVFYTETAVNTRKLVPGETTESGAPWTTAVNALVDAQGSGNTVGAAASVATEVLTAADTTGKVLTRGPLLHVAQAGNALVTPRVAGDALELVPGANGGGAGPPLRLDVGTGSSNATRGNVWMGFRQGEGPSATLGAGGALLMKHVGTAPSGGTYSGERALYPKSDGWYESDGTTESKLAAGLTGAGAGTANALTMVDATGNVLSRAGVTSDATGNVTLGSPNSADTTPISGALEFPVVGKLDSLPAGVAYRFFAYTDPVLDTVPDPDETHDDYILRYGYNVGLAGAARWQDDVTKHAAGWQIEGDVYVYGGHYAETHFQASAVGGASFCRSFLTAIDLDTYEGSNLLTGTFNVQNSAQTVNAISVAETGLVTLGHEVTSAYKATFGSNVVLDAGHVKAGSFSIQGDLLGAEKGYINGHLIVSSQGGISSKTDAICASTHCFQGVGNFDVTGVAKYIYGEGSGHESNVTISRTAAYGGGGLWTIGLGGDRGYLLRFGIASFAHVDVDGTTGALDLVNSNTAYAVNIKIGAATILGATTSGLTLAGSTARTGAVTHTLGAGTSADVAITGIGSASVVYLTVNAAGSQLDSLVAAADGTEITIYAEGGVLTVGNEATGTAANKMHCQGGVNKVCLNPDVVRLRYRAGSVNRWLVG